jgi:hypothetical protein
MKAPSSFLCSLLAFTSPWHTARIQYPFDALRSRRIGACECSAPHVPVCGRACRRTRCRTSLRLAITTAPVSTVHSIRLDRLGLPIIQPCQDGFQVVRLDSGQIVQFRRVRLQ